MTVTNWQELIGKRVLIMYFRVLSEQRVSEVAPSGEFIKFVMPETGLFPHWLRVSDVTLVEVLP